VQFYEKEVLMTTATQYIYKSLSFHDVDIVDEMYDKLYSLMSELKYRIRKGQKVSHIIIIEKAEVKVSMLIYSMTDKLSTVFENISKRDAESIQKKYIQGKVYNTIIFENNNQIK
tara:strand:- start:13911 stop:14255 length:345 start_codon:yes stop_codon:yes gene_type:complete